MCKNKKQCTCGCSTKKKQSSLKEKKINYMIQKLEEVSGRKVSLKESSGEELEKFTDTILAYSEKLSKLVRYDRYQDQLLPIINRLKNVVSQLETKLNT